MISSEKFEEMVSELEEELLAEYWAPHTRGVAEGIVLRHMEAAGHKVEPPPILPGITSGEWIPVKNTRDVRVGNLSIAGVVGVTEAEGVANTVFMAGSKKLAEAVIGMFETWSSGGHGKEALAMLEALENMGCDVDKFRVAVDAILDEKRTAEEEWKMYDDSVPVRH